MIKRITCIDCPKGCQLNLEINGSKLLKVSGNECEKGETYAKQEIENPERVLTSTVLTEGLKIKMLPVRTNRAIPKDKILALMDVVKAVRWKTPVKVGDVIVPNLLNLGTDLVSARDISG
jgi:CxxC motif-containing protein